jgi:hypothetical protein
MQDQHLRATRRVLFLSVLALACASCAADAGDQDSEHSQDSQAVTGVAQELSCPTSTPAALAVPAGNRLAFSLRARGTQNYVCKQAADGSYAWTFVEPDAQLYGAFGQVAGHHYAGPTWEANDGSTVVGTKVAGATVDATAIAWLLLKASAHTGDGRMAKVTYVQRLDTVGGNAPATGCDAAHAAATVDVAYSALYSFYR